MAPGAADGRHPTFGENGRRDGQGSGRPENQVVFHMFSDGRVVKEFVGDRR